MRKKAEVKIDYTKEQVQIFNDAKSACCEIAHQLLKAEIEPMEFFRIFILLLEESTKIVIANSEHFDLKEPQTETEAKKKEHFDLKEPQTESEPKKKEKNKLNPGRKIF